MRARRAIAMFLSMAAMFVACSKSSDTGPPATRCDPGSNVFCICFDNSPGTKACTSDGESFEACISSDTGVDCSMPGGSGGGGAGGSGVGGDGAGGVGGSGGMTTTISASSSMSTSSSTGNGGNGGNGGSGGASVMSQCPGDPLTVAIGADTTVVGDTSTSIDGNSGPCGGKGAPEVVYAVTPQANGTLVITLAGVANGDPVLYAREGACDKTGTLLGCSDATAAGGTETLTLEAIAGSTYWVFADGHGDVQYSLTLHLTTGIPGDTCAGIPLAVEKGTDVYAAGDTSIATANYKPSAACSAATSTKDIVYSITPAQTGTLSVTMTAAFDSQLYARSGSCTVGTEIGCSVGGGAEEIISVPVTQGTKVSVFADGQNAGNGPYTMLFHLQ